MTLERLESRLSLFRHNIERLDTIPQASLDEFSSDPRNLPAALHLLQTAIQALIDVGSFATAYLGLSAPARSRDILETLEAAGHLPEGASARFGPMFSFRNRVVHLYDHVAPEVVYEILRERSGHLEELLDLLLATLDSDEAG